MKTMKKSMLVALAALFCLSVSAQQVTTMYFLENAPMRHTINPAFQPYSNGFINFSPLGWTSLSVGNNSLTVSDIFMMDPTTGRTILPIHPNADKQAFLKVLRSMTLAEGEASLGLINMGFRIKDKGYLTIGLNERVQFGGTMPKSAFDFLLGGGMTNLGAGQWNVEVYDITGRKVFENRMDGRSVLDLGKCQKGLYFLKASNESRSLTTKVVIR